MRYIFIEDKAGQSVYDIDTTTWYAMSMASDTPKITIERVGTARVETIGFTYSYVISFWQQLAKQVDGRCGIKDAREKMESFVEEVDCGISD